MAQQRLLAANKLGSNNFAVRVYDTAANAFVASITISTTCSAVTSTLVSADGLTGYVAWTNSSNFYTTVSVLNLSTNTITGSYAYTANTSSPTCAVFSSDQTKIILGNSGGLFFNVSTKAFTPFSAGNASVNDLSFAASSTTGYAPSGGGSGGVVFVDQANQITAGDFTVSGTNAYLTDVFAYPAGGYFYIFNKTAAQLLSYTAPPTSGTTPVLKSTTNITAACPFDSNSTYHMTGGLDSTGLKFYSSSGGSHYLYTFSSPTAVGVASTPSYAAAVGTATVGARAYAFLPDGVNMYLGSTQAWHINMSTGAATSMDTGTYALSFLSVNAPTLNSTITGSSTMPGAANMASIGRSNLLAQSSPSGDGSVSASGIINPIGTANMPGAGFLAASGAASAVSTASLTGAASFAATGTLGLLASASMIGSGSFSAIALGYILAAATFVGEGSLAASSVITLLNQIELDGGGSLAAAGTTNLSGQTTFAGSSTVNTAPLYLINQAAAMTGSASLSPALPLYVNAASQFAGSGTLSAGINNYTLGAAILSGSGSLNDVGLDVLLGAASFTGASRISALASSYLNAAAQFSGSASGSAMTLVTASGYALLPGAAMLGATGSAGLLAQSGFSGSATATATALLVIPGFADLTASATATMNGVTVVFGQSEEDGSAGANGTGQLYGLSTVIGMITLPGAAALTLSPAPLPAPVPQETRDGDFKSRVYEVLGAFARMYPTLFFRVELWRNRVISKGGFKDDTQAKWIRLAEDVEVFKWDKEERWFEASVGIIRQRISRLVLPAYYDLQSDDEVVINGEAWFVTKVTANMGVLVCELDKPKSRFKRPLRGDATNRIVGVKAAIG